MPPAVTEDPPEQKKARETKEDEECCSGEGCEQCEDCLDASVQCLFSIAECLKGILLCGACNCEGCDCDCDCNS
jgi:hypothetical protein